MRLISYRIAVLSIFILGSSDLLSAAPSNSQQGKKSNGSPSKPKTEPANPKTNAASPSAERCNEVLKSSSGNSSAEDIKQIQKYLVKKEPIDQYLSKLIQCDHVQHMNQVLPELTRAADTFGIPKEFLACQMAKESRFDPNACSTSRAKGLPQFNQITFQTLDNAIKGRDDLPKRREFVQCAWQKSFPGHSPEEFTFERLQKNPKMAAFAMGLYMRMIIDDKISTTGRQTIESYKANLPLDNIPDQIKTSLIAAYLYNRGSSHIATLSELTQRNVTTDWISQIDKNPESEGHKQGVKYLRWINDCMKQEAQLGNEYDPVYPMRIIEPERFNAPEKCQFFICTQQCKGDCVAQLQRKKVQNGVATKSVKTDTSKPVSAASSPVPTPPSPPAARPDGGTPKSGNLKRAN